MGSNDDGIQQGFSRIERLRTTDRRCRVIMRLSRLVGEDFLARHQQTCK